MADDKKINVSILPVFAENTIENLLDKPTKSIGETFNDIWFLVLGGPLRNAVDKKKLQYQIELENYKKEIEEELKKIDNPSEKSVDLQIVGQTLEASKYCISKPELRRMFAKLIASSIDECKQDKTHPSFSEVIRQMSADEARLIKYIYINMEKEKNRFPLVDIRQILRRNIEESEKGVNIVKIVDKRTNHIRTLRTRYRFDNHELGRTIMTNKSNIGEVSGCDNPYRISEYIQNLERLRLIDIRNRPFTSEREYSVIINSSFMDEICVNYNEMIFNDEVILYFIKKYFCITEYGLNFISTCVE